MGMSLSFYIINDGKIKSRADFTDKISVCLFDEIGKSRISAIQKLFILVEGNIDLLYRMNSNRYDTIFEELELERHEDEYEPFNQEWHEKKLEIKDRYTKERKVKYPKTKEVKLIISNIHKLIEDTIKDKLEDELLNKIGLKLEPSYSILMMKEDFKKLNTIVNDRSNQELEICYSLM